MDGDLSGLVIHAVDAVARQPEHLARAVLTRRGPCAEGKRLVPGAAREHVADAAPPAGLIVLTARGDRLAAITRFHLDALYPRFGLPASLTAGR